MSPPLARTPVDVAGFEDRIAWARERVGNNVFANLVGVNRSQPSRWASGAEQPSAATRVRVLDVLHLLERLGLAMTASQAEVWLESANPHLAGSRPVDVVRAGGVPDVLVALDAHETGASA